jgi:hypothetical protein
MMRLLKEKFPKQVFQVDLSSLQGKSRQMMIECFAEFVKALVGNQNPADSLILVCEQGNEQSINTLLTSPLTGTVRQVFPNVHLIFPSPYDRKYNTSSFAQLRLPMISPNKRAEIYCQQKVIQDLLPQKPTIELHPNYLAKMLDEWRKEKGKQLGWSEYWSPYPTLEEVCQRLQEIRQYSIQAQTWDVHYLEQYWGIKKSNG